jgi:hypothetical protein
MKSVPFSEILYGVCQIIGLDITTLNAKSFGAVRDLVSRRISVIWDREEWPDVERRISTFPGIPIQTVQPVNVVLQTQGYSDLILENGEEIWIQNSEGTIPVRCSIDQYTFSPKVNLIDFEDDAYKKGTVGDTYLKITNPFYVKLPDGTLYSTDKEKLKFTYGTQVGENGEYLIYVDIDVPYGEVLYSSTYYGPNALQTSKIIFESNRQYLVQLDDNSLHGLEAYDKDPRVSTKANYQAFVVEDLDNTSNGWSESGSVLRFFSEGEKYVKYRQKPKMLAGGKFQPSQSYPIGSQVYYNLSQESNSATEYAYSTSSYEGSGDFWVALLPIDSNLSPAPGTPGMWWTKNLIPYRFKDFLVNGVAADFLRSEGRADEANIFDQLAEASVQQQIDVLVRQQGQVQRMNMVYNY